jgi:hypothetical protein
MFWGNTAMRGYYQDAAATAEVLSREGGSGLGTWRCGTTRRVREDHGQVQGHLWRVEHKHGRGCALHTSRGSRGDVGGATGRRELRDGSNESVDAEELMAFRRARLPGCAAGAGQGHGQRHQLLVQEAVGWVKNRVWGDK